MMVFILILFSNFVVAPYIAGFTGIEAIYLSFPSEFWGLLTVSVGGYLGARTYEKKNGVEAPKPKQERAEATKRAKEYEYGPARMDDIEL